jgi:hypothetical protein
MQQQQGSAYNQLVQCLSGDEQGMLASNFETAFQQDIECIR